MARFCVRKRLKETDVTAEEWQDSLHRRDPWMGRPPVGSRMAPVIDEAIDKTQHVEEVGKATESGGRSTDGDGEPPMAPS